MIGTNEAFDQFITDQRWAVITTLRKKGQPSSSFVAYAREGDVLIVSTPGGTFKRKTLDADPRVTMCVMTNQEPFNFVTVEGLAEIQTEDIVDPTRKVFKAIEDTGFKEPKDFKGWLEKQRRVIIRIHPERVSGVIR
jgi:PPOX class probable F420-dependent enzyme